MEARKGLRDSVAAIISDAVSERGKRERGTASISLDAADRVMETLASRTRWNQRAIANWSNETFGVPVSNLSIAIRANEEMAELLRCLARDDSDQAARMEVADVVIILCRLVERLGGRMAEDVSTKMEINAKRVWRRRGDGHGQHVRVDGPCALSTEPSAAGLTDDELLRELAARGLIVVS